MARAETNALNDLIGAWSENRLDAEHLYLTAENVLRIRKLPNDTNNVMELIKNAMNILYR